MPEHLLDRIRPLSPANPKAAVGNAVALKNKGNCPPHEISYQRTMTLLYQVTHRQESAPGFVHMFDSQLGLNRPVIHKRYLKVALEGPLRRYVEPQNSHRADAGGVWLGRARAC